VEKAIKEMRNKKATEDYGVPRDVLKILGVGGLKIMTKLVHTVYETGERSKKLTEVTIITLRRINKLQNAATIAQ
jgi:hypothetical protein